MRCRSAIWTLALLAITGCAPLSRTAESWPVKSELEAWNAPVAAIKFAPDGKSMATLEYPLFPYDVRAQCVGKRHGIVRVWHRSQAVPWLDEFEMQAAFQVDPHGLDCMQFTPDGRELIAWSQAEFMRWNLADRSLNRIPAEGTKVVSPTTQQFAVGVEEHTVEVRDVSSQAKISLPMAEDNWLTPVAFTTNGQWLALHRGRSPGPFAILIWDWQHGKIVSEFPIKGGSRWFFQFAPDGARCAITSISDSEIMVYEVASRKVVARFPLGKLAPWSIDLSCNGLLACSGEGDDEHDKKRFAELVVWDVASQREVMRKQEPKYWGITAVAFSPDGNTLAAGTCEGKVVFYEVAAKSGGDDEHSPAH